MLLADRAAEAALLSKVRRADFFQVDHRMIFDAIVHVYRAGRPIDPMVVREELTRRGTLADVGGIEYLACVINAVPTAADAEVYARTVRDLADRRRDSN